MRKFLLYISILLLANPMWSQVTSGYHRISQVIARSPQGLYAQIVPYATVYASSTATGTSATIYSDPLLTILIPGSKLSADKNGNYSYYMPLNYCVNESISSPGMSTISLVNICQASGSTSIPITIPEGGTGATTAIGARSNLGAAASGANGDITSLTGLTTPLPLTEGGTASTTASGARSNLGAAASGVNSDITSLTGLSTPIPINEGGTNSTTAPNALTALGAAALAGATFTGPIIVPSVASTHPSCSFSAPYLEYNGGCGGGGSATSLPFSAVTSASNTTAAMTVGSGGSLGVTGTGVINANQLLAVPFCTGFTPTNAQYLQYTTGNSPNPCYTAASPSGTGNTTSTSLTTNYLPESNGANSIINSPFYDANSGSTPAKFAGASGLLLVADATYADWISMRGNTTNPSLATGSFNLIGPSSASITAYGWQVPSAGNSSAGVMHIAAPSSSVSLLSVSAVALTDLATQGADTAIINMTASTAQPTAVAIPTTAHGIWLGEGTATPPGITAAGAANTVLLGQGSSSDPSFGTVTSSYVDSSVVVDTGNTTTASNKVAISTSTAGKINFIDYPSPYSSISANCVSGSGGAGWNTTLVASCRGGTYNLGGSLPFSDASTAQFNIELPNDWDSTVNPYVNLLFSTGLNTAGTIIFNVAISCYATNNSGADDQAFQTAQTFSTITAAHANYGNSVTLQLNNTSITGCSAGGGMIVKVTRATDTASSAVPVTEAVVTIPRKITVQAE